MSTVFTPSPCGSPREEAGVRIAIGISESAILHVGRWFRARKKRPDIGSGPRNATRLLAWTESSGGGSPRSVGAIILRDAPGHRSLRQRTPLQHPPRSHV